MWIAQIRVQGSNALLGNAARKCSVSLSGYPVYTKESGNNLYVDFVGEIFGSEENEKKFFKELKKHPRTITIEKEDNLMIGRIKESIAHAHVYGSNLFNVEPVMITEEGTEYWTLGSNKKDHIIKFIKAVEKSPGAEIISVQQKKLNNFIMLSLQPNLSNKQRLAMDLAIKNGYYDYPRKTSVEKLAKMSKVAFSTFQAHLRKAENKFIPYCFNRFYTNS